MPSGKARLVDYMTLYPQTCIVTGYPNQKNQKQALDLGFDIPDYGHAYVSELGMAWLSRQFGYVSGEEAGGDVEKLKKELAEARERISELELSISRIPETIEGLLNGLKQLSVNTVNDLLGIAGTSLDGDDNLPASEGEPEAAERPRPVVKTTGRNNKAAS